MKKLYIIGGFNGAGKTTASYTILPDILDCEEFINADEIARGLSPFNPDKAKIEAGRIMLKKIKSLIDAGSSFSFESTLATKSYFNIIERAKDEGYETTCIFFWLSSPELAISRVQQRVKEGGHDIPVNVIKRRYKNGIANFFDFYEKIVDNWIFIDNSGNNHQVIAENQSGKTIIHRNKMWSKIMSSI
jgi:predicted ABC-type ATPase